MLNSIRTIETLYHTKLIRISAQCYLKNFYNKLDFFSVGNEYLEDGIPHINMIRK